MLRLDHVVRNCKDESVNFTGNIGEELKKATSDYNRVSYGTLSLLKLGLQKIRNLGNFAIFYDR